MRQHGASAGVIKLRLVTISLQMSAVAAAATAAIATFRYHRRNIGTPAFQYQSVWMPKEIQKK